MQKLDPGRTPMWSFGHTNLGDRGIPDRWIPVPLPPPVPPTIGFSVAKERHVFAGRQCRKFEFLSLNRRQVSMPNYDTRYPSTCPLSRVEFATIAVIATLLLNPDVRTDR